MRTSDNRNWSKRKVFFPPWKWVKIMYNVPSHVYFICFLLFPSSSCLLPLPFVVVVKGKNGIFTKMGEFLLLSLSRLFSLFFPFFFLHPSTISILMLYFTLCTLCSYSLYINITTVTKSRILFLFSPSFISFLSSFSSFLTTVEGGMKFTATK